MPQLLATARSEESRVRADRRSRRGDPVVRSPRWRTERWLLGGLQAKRLLPHVPIDGKLYARFTPVQSCVRSSPSGLGLRVRDWPHRGEKFCVAVANSYDLFSFIGD